MHIVKVNNMHKIKSSLLVLSALLILVFAQVVSAEEITMELVANTTSDAYGDYTFIDIPNGNYQLVALKYTSAMGGAWLMAESDVAIENGTDIVNADLTLGFADPGVQDPVLSLLERASISGKTLSTPMGGSAQNYSYVPVVLKSESGWHIATSGISDGASISISLSYSLKGFERFTTERYVIRRLIFPSYLTSQ